MSSNLFCLDSVGRIILFHKKYKTIWQSFNTFSNIKEASEFLNDITNITYHKTIKTDRKSWIVYQNQVPLFEVYSEHNGWPNLRDSDVEWINGLIHHEGNLANKVL